MPIWRKSIFYVTKISVNYNLKKTIFFLYNVFLTEYLIMHCAKTIYYSLRCQCRVSFDSEKNLKYAALRMHTL